MSNLGKVFANPLVWAFAFLTAGGEVMGFRLFDIAFQTESGFLGSFSSYSMCRLVIIAATIPLAAQNVSLRNRPWLIALCMAFIVLGSLLFASGLSAAQPAFSSIGFVCMVIGSEILYLSLFERMSALFLNDARACLVCGSLLDVLLVATFIVRGLASIYICGVFLIVGATFLLLKPRLSDNLAAAGREAREGLTNIRVPRTVIMGFFSIALAFGLSNDLLYQNDPSVTVAVVASTKFVALVLFVAMTWRMGDTGYGILSRLTATFAVGAFCLLLSQMDTVWANVAMALGYSMFELVGSLAIINLMTIWKAGPLSALCVFKAIVYTGHVVGGLLTAALGNGDMPLAGLLAITLLLAIVAIWCFGKDDLWSTLFEDESDGIHKDTDDARSSFEAELSRIASLYALSPREKEVAGRFARGRSAMFIAEELCLSENTIRGYIKHVYEKCDVHSRQDLITLIAGKESATSL